MKTKFKKGDALLIVDVQYDFLPGGALAVADGDKILPVLNEWLAAANQTNIPIILSRDWHPKNHISFKAQGGPWPPHCVKQTHGAQFSQDLKYPQNAIIVDKATEANKETYSALGGVTATDGKPLPEVLRELNIKRLWMGGLAFDYCVKHSALDAKKLGFEVVVVLPACKAIAEQTEQETFQLLTDANVILELDSRPYS